MSLMDIFFIFYVTLFGGMDLCAASYHGLVSIYGRDEKIAMCLMSKVITIVLSSIKVN